MKTFTVVFTVIFGALLALGTFIGAAYLVLGCGRSAHYFC